MRSVWKYELDLKDEQSVPMPKGAQGLCVQVQGEIPCVWAYVESTAPLVAESKEETIKNIDKMEIKLNQLVGAIAAIDTFIKETEHDLITPVVDDPPNP